MELISREEAINVFIRWNKKEFGYSDLNREMRFIDEIESLPTIEERKEGEWIEVKSTRGGHECSKCHNYAPNYQSGSELLSIYCPNCGAKMKGE